MIFGRETALLRQKFTALGSPERAQKQKAYLKSELTFLGVETPAIRAAAKEWTAANAAINRAQLGGFVKHLWKTNVHELRAVGIAILELRRELFVAADLPLVEELLRQARSWAYVDWLAVHVAGDLVARFPKLKKDLRRWAKDEDFWLRRAALLALLPALRTGEGDLGLLAELAVPMLPDQEFFIRKAIGWVLRETAKKQPAFVEQFVAEHGAAMSPLTRKEATKRRANGNGDGLDATAGDGA